MANGPPAVSKSHHGVLVVGSSHALQGEYWINKATVDVARAVVVAGRADRIDVHWLMQRLDACAAAGCKHGWSCRLRTGWWWCLRHGWICRIGTRWWWCLRGCRILVRAAADYEYTMVGFGYCGRAVREPTSSTASRRRSASPAVGPRALQPHNDTKVIARLRARGELGRPLSEHWGNPRDMGSQQALTQHGHGIYCVTRRQPPYS